MGYKELDETTKKRANLSFFLIMFPSVLLAIIPSRFGLDIWYPLVIKALLLVYQYFVVKNFVESAYE